MTVGGASAACAGTKCGVCERRFGCLTEAWGKCCVQFFQLNGKRSLRTYRRIADDDAPNKRSTIRPNSRRAAAFAQLLHRTRRKVCEHHCRG